MTHSSLLRSPSANNWQRIGIKHHHGINIPLFALYSAKSAGVGEIPDLLPVIDWVKSVGMDVIQLLPINDTGADASPYNARSAFALNPIFLGIASLENIPEELLPALKELQGMTGKRPIPYEEIRPKKIAFIRDYVTAQAANFRTSESYQTFLQENTYWLSGYALFCLLKRRFDQKHHSLWQPPFSIPTPKVIEEWLAQEAAEVEIIYMMQYLLFQQFTAVKAYAEKLGVFIMGDIPILISPDSADVWQWPGFFHDLLSAGAPPDMYAKDGQSWGFPLYHWKALEQVDFIWWRQRLKTAERLFHLFRIDHAVGFFRIWAVLQGKIAKEGAFVPHEETFWKDHGTRLLKMLIDSCAMLPIAEDLGVVPPFVRDVLVDLGICGTRVIRWERLWKQWPAPFIPYDQYLPESLTTVSTHDSSLLRQWWQEQKDESQAFCAFKKWNWQEKPTLDQIKTILKDSHQTASLFHVNLWHEYFALFPELRYDRVEDDRINQPGVISDHNWSFRFKCPLEEICQFAPLQNLVRELLS